MPPPFCNVQLEIEETVRTSYGTRVYESTIHYMVHSTSNITAVMLMTFIVKKTEIHFNEKGKSFYENRPIATASSST